MSMDQVKRILGDPARKSSVTNRMGSGDVDVTWGYEDVPNSYAFAEFSNGVLYKFRDVENNEVYE